MADTSLYLYEYYEYVHRCIVISHLAMAIVRLSWMEVTTEMAVNA